MSPIDVNIYTFLFDQTETHSNCNHFALSFTVNFVESFAFGSLISAVDPVATVAIFHAIDVDPVLNMLVFGESILNGEHIIEINRHFTQ